MILVFNGKAERAKQDKIWNFYIKLNGSRNKVHVGIFKMVIIGVVFIIDLEHPSCH